MGPHPFWALPLPWDYTTSIIFASFNRLRFLGADVSLHHHARGGRMRSFLSLEHPLPPPPPQRRHPTSSSPTPSPSHTPSQRLPHPLFPIGHPIYQRFKSQPKSDPKKDHPSQNEQAPSHSPEKAANPEPSPKPPSVDTPSFTPAQHPLSEPSEDLNTHQPLWNPNPGPRTRSQSLVLLRGVRDNSPAPDHSNGFQPPLSQLDGGLDELQEPPAPHQL